MPVTIEVRDDFLTDCLREFDPDEGSNDAEHDLLVEIADLIHAKVKPPVQFVYVVEPNFDTGPDEAWVFETEEDARDFASHFGDEDGGAAVSEQPILTPADAKEAARQKVTER